jgi:hypothetical protein
VYRNVDPGVSNQFRDPIKHLVIIAGNSGNRINRYVTVYQKFSLIPFKLVGVLRITGKIPTLKQTPIYNGQIIFRPVEQGVK